MYESYYGFSEKPFSLLPDPDFLYLGEQHGQALTTLEYGLLNQAGFTVITGEIGSGKTTLVRHLLNHVDDDVTVGLISNTHRSFGELLEWILLAFGLDYKHKQKAELYETFVGFLIEEYAQGRRTVLIVDEAQNMDADTLEDLRLISNINADKDSMLQVILVGQPGLRRTLRRRELSQFASRVTVDFHLSCLSLDETARYIQHRVEVAGGPAGLFGDPVCKAIHEYSGGIPRLINAICDTALVYGFGERRDQLTVELVEEVVRDKAKGGLFRSNEELPTELIEATADLPESPLEEPPVVRAVPSGEAKVAEIDARLKKRRSPSSASAGPRNTLHAREEIVFDMDEELYRELFSTLRGDEP